VPTVSEHGYAGIEEEVVDKIADWSTKSPISYSGLNGIERTAR
jgi:hypothetical protein